MELKKASKLALATRLLLVKCYDNKMVKSPLTWVIYPLTQPQVENQQQQQQKNPYLNVWGQIYLKYYKFLINSVCTTFEFKVSEDIKVVLQVPTLSHVCVMMEHSFA